LKRSRLKSELTKTVFKAWTKLTWGMPSAMPLWQADALHLKCKKRHTFQHWGLLLHWHQDELLIAVTQWKRALFKRWQDLVCPICMALIGKKI
jgi:hypothetical protein